MKGRDRTAEAPLPIGEMLALGPFDDVCPDLTERVRAVLAVVEHWENVRWRQDARESEWTRLMVREVMDALNGVTP